MFKNILNTEFKFVISAALTIGFFSFVSKILGLIRNRIFAGEFGAGDMLDIYFAAFRIPDLLYNVFIIGMVSAVFLPIFSEYYAKSKEEAWRLVNTAIGTFLLVLIFFSIIAIIFAPQLISLVAYGFDDAKKELAVSLTRVMFLSPIFLGISSIVSSVLQAHKIFFSFALAPVLYNLGIIIAALFFVKPFGVMGLAFGVVLGAFLHLLIQLPALFKLGFRPHFIFNFFHPGIKKIILLSLPRTIGLVAHQLNFIVITAIASTLSVGSISVFNFSNDLQYVPISIVALAFMSAVFPVLSASFAKGDMQTFLKEFYLTVNQIIFLVLPLSIFLILERAQIVRVILGYGEFSWENTRLTAAALGAFAISIFAQSLIPLFSRAFYAMQNTKTPVFINVCSVAINIFFSFYFLHLMRFGGVFAEVINTLFRISDVDGNIIIALPLAFSLASIINILWLYLAFSLKVHAFDGRSILHSLIKVNIALAAMAIATFWALRIMALWVNMQTFIGIFTQGVFAFIVGAVVYAGMSYMLRISAFYAFYKAFSAPIRKLFFTRSTPISIDDSE